MRYVLLPPPLQDLATWKDYADSIDTVFKPILDDPRDTILSIRDTHNYVITDYTRMQSAPDLLPVDRTTLTKQVEFLGFDHYDPTLFASDDYQRLYSTLGQYYQEKGTQNFIDYFGFVLNTQFTVDLLWTQDYVTFIAEGTVGIGTPIYQGGAWYPTSHVNLRVDLEKYAGFPQAAVTSLFKDIAPINVVLRSFVLQSTAPVSENIAMAGYMLIVLDSGNAGNDTMFLAMAGSISVWNNN